MNSKKILFTAFIIVALVQLYVPAKMILDKEIVLMVGTEYKFKTAPIDPIDPFRGKYITLGYDQSVIEVPNVQDWRRDEIIYALITTDTAGFAKIKSVSKENLSTVKILLKLK